MKISRLYKVLAQVKHCELYNICHGLEESPHHNLERKNQEAELLNFFSLPQP